MVLPNSSFQESSDKVVHENQSWYIMLCHSSIYCLPLQLLFCSTDNCGLLSYDSCLYCCLALSNLLQIPDITGLLARKLLLLLEVCFLYLEGFPIGERLSLQLYFYPPLQLSSLFLIGVIQQRECYGRVLKQVIARQYLILTWNPFILASIPCCIVSPILPDFLLVPFFFFSFSKLRFFPSFQISFHWGPQSIGQASTYLYLIYKLCSSFSPMGLLGPRQVKDVAEHLLSHP